MEKYNMLEMQYAHCEEIYKKKYAVILLITVIGLRKLIQAPNKKIGGID